MSSQVRKPRKASLRKCINEYCKWCIYDPRGLGLGTWREQTKGCTAKDCPLYSVRPVSAKRQESASEIRGDLSPPGEGR